MKLNVNGSVRGFGNRMGIGRVLYDGVGCWFLGYSKSVGYGDMLDHPQ